MSERIEAENLGQAAYFLKVRGYSNVRFYEDESGEDTRRMVRADTNVDPLPPDVWTPAHEIESRQRRGAWQKLAWAFRQHLFIIGPLLAWNLWSFRTGRPFTWSDWAGFIVTPVYLGYFLLLAAPSQVFHQILDASVWRDWTRLRLFIRIGRGLRRLMGRGLPENEMLIREAYALADEGKLDEALRIMEVVRADPHVKPYHYLARLGTVYEFAGRYDRQIECLREAQRVGVGGASPWIDLAMALVRRGRDIAGAKEALAHAREKEMPVLAKAFAAWCEGIIACEEGDYPKAKTLLLSGLDDTRTTGSQLMVGIRADMKAYLCMACARCGDTNEAQRLWAECAALVQARKETELVNRCRAALANFTSRSSA